MSAVLATNMSNNMSNRAGYLSLNLIMDDNFTTYTFKDCIKYNKEGFGTWMCYWEGTPFVVQCVVKSTVLANGFTKVAILSKDLKMVVDVGTFPGKKNIWAGYIVNGRYQTGSDVQKLVNDTFAKVGSTKPTQVQQSVPEREVLRSSDKKVYTPEEIQHFKNVMQENWGCTFK